MAKKFVVWDDTTKELGSANTISRSRVRDLFSSPFWDNIPDKPSVYPPEPHTHDWINIEVPRSIATDSPVYVRAIDDPDYTTKASDTAERTYPDTEGAWIDDWDIGTVETLTDDYGDTKIKYQVDMRSDDIGGTISGGIRLLEDGVEIGSATRSSWTGGKWYTLSFEVYTQKTSATYKGQVKMALYSPLYTFSTRNRYLYMKKRRWRLYI
ncbi:MAG: hypothetical protein DRO40_07940 [Thermoprotei archaeon]|nr:MAG: hypothetical protein DRO40_07940 [Thermoprotei archaeon]